MHNITRGGGITFQKSCWPGFGSFYQIRVEYSERAVVLYYGVIQRTSSRSETARSRETRRMRTERFPELQNQDDKLKADRRICAKLGFYNLLAGLPEGPRGNIAFYLIAYRFNNKTTTAGRIYIYKCNCRYMQLHFGNGSFRFWVVLSV